MDESQLTKLHLTVAAIVERQGEFLVVEELAGGQLVINQPAGHVEPGEALADAVIREVKEETAWTFEPTAIIGAYLWTQPVSGEQFLRAVYHGDICSHDSEQPLDEGILRNLWLTPEDLLKRQTQLRSPMVMRAIDDYLAGIRHPVNMYQHIAVEQLAEKAAVV
jgi:8-oxo-dGTP pyrophosphatase MutT (NUDIX family)